METSPMKRKAFTLVEMVVVMSIGTVLLTVSMVMLFALLKSEGSSRRHLEYCTVLNKLEEQFRCDVNQAVSTKVIPSDDVGMALELSLPEPEITLVIYRCEPKEISREEKEGDKVLRRESYNLPDDMIASIEQTPLGVGSVVKISIEEKPLLDRKIHYPTARIEAVLGKDHRFERK
jgi:prepilin-type N-terminal cleavage/methylation domain-containing protein